MGYGATDPVEPQSVLIIGAGAAGIATAWSLSRFPKKFQVHVWEAQSQAGGVATTESISTENSTYYINDGVQGGASSYRNVTLLHKEFGFEPQPVGFRVCFGKDQFAWNNYEEDTNLSPFLQKMQPDIERFGKLLKWVMRFELFFIFVPIHRLLSWFRFSKEFGEHMVYPLTALFFGTGNRTSNVSSAIVARVFLDPDLCLFPYDSERLLSKEAPMFSFQRLDEIYKKMSSNMKNATFYFDRSVKSVDRTMLQERGHIEVIDGNEVCEHFHHVVFACPADIALSILSHPTRMESRCLGNVRYYEDVTITHSDSNYMQKHYTMAKDLEESRKRREMYYIRTEPSDRSRVEMSFNLASYQTQLKDSKDPVYQTIFLNKDEEHLWTKDEIDTKKQLLVKWWHQFAHETRHFYSVVPFVRFLQNPLGKTNTWFCGAYTLVNTHEIATISGLAVAHRLGAPYPFGEKDKLAKMQFEQYLFAIHGVGLMTKIALCVALAAILVIFIVLLMKVS